MGINGHCNLPPRPPPSISVLGPQLQVANAPYFATGTSGAFLLLGGRRLATLKLVAFLLASPQKEPTLLKASLNHRNTAVLKEAEVWLDGLASAWFGAPEAHGGKNH